MAMERNSGIVRPEAGGIGPVGKADAQRAEVLPASVAAFTSLIRPLRTS
jgi:hypothetical protein